MKNFDRLKVTKVKNAKGKTVYCAFTNIIDYHFSDLPGWAQSLPDNALLVVNPEIKDGQVILPDYIRTVSNIVNDSFPKRIARRAITRLAIFCVKRQIPSFH